MIRVCAAVALVLCGGQAALSATATLTVQADHLGAVISPMLYGIFFEEINHAGDGGLYAEMVGNRSFEDGATPDPWTQVTVGTAKGTIAIEPIRAGSSFNRNALRISVCDINGGSIGAANPGYWGMSVKQSAVYDVTIIAKCGGGFLGDLKVQLRSPSGTVLAEGQTTALTTDWQSTSVALTASKTVPNAQLVVLASEPGMVWLDMVSMFPRDTFKNRANGLRPDLAGYLEGIRPAFVRFPGGCWVEGNTMAESYRWKQTIGPVADRRTQYNLWQYMSGNGLGFHEYLQMSEDLGAEPLFVINVGMSHNGVVALDQMAPYVQDALDAIEYANGPVTSTWGAKRAAAGHPAPFNLKYMEIGNENGGTDYAARFPLFYDAIKAQYPTMKLIADVWGGYPTNRTPDLIDEHYYSNPAFFTSNAHTPLRMAAGRATSPARSEKRRS
jgi:hypothetical protein